MSAGRPTTATKHLPKRSVRVATYCTIDEQAILLRAKPAHYTLSDYVHERLFGRPPEDDMAEVCRRSTERKHRSPRVHDRRVAGSH